ncbi:MAG: hypothetical protein ABFD66_15425 [Smithella sp.]
MMPGGNTSESIEATFKGLGKIFENPVKAMEIFINSVKIKLEKAGWQLDKKGKIVEKKIRQEKSFPLPF